MLGGTTSQAINTQYYQAVFDDILSCLYPTQCECGTRCDRPMPSRPYSVRCPSCLRQKSKLAHTPFRNLRIPQWMAGYAVEESYHRHPQVITASELSRRLEINYRTALLLKRRIQLLASEQLKRIYPLIRQELETAFPRPYKLPAEGNDVRPETIDRPVVHADTMVLFSASQRANKGRKRHRNRGLTSSIYLSERLGGHQIGTLCHVMGTKQGWVLIDSVPDLRANTVGPIIRDRLPRNTAIFTDEAYTWLYRIYPNHRMVNHSKKSADRRFKYARDRWCQNGVHNQVSEGLNGSLKKAMRAYSYFRPQYSTLYLNEWAFFKNLRYFGLERLAENSLAAENPVVRRSRTGCLIESARDSAEGGNGPCGASADSIFRQKLPFTRLLEPYFYRAERIPGASQRPHARSGSASPELERILKLAPFASLREAIQSCRAFWAASSLPYQRAKQRKYARLANHLWDRIQSRDWHYLSDLIAETRIDNRPLMRVLRRWADTGIIELRDLTPGPSKKHAIEYGFRRLLPGAVPLPEILYRQNRKEFLEETEKWQNDR